MIRSFDVLISSIGLVILSPLFLLLAAMGVKNFGKAFYLQKRVGRNGTLFTIVKFRSLKIGTPEVATHSLNIAEISAYGRFLRRTKLDELPQLLNVFKGDMSIVGPRPCLVSQQTLNAYRMKNGVQKARPGITGLAQLHGIDMSQPRLLSKLDYKMGANLGLCSYVQIITATILTIKSRY